VIRVENLNVKAMTATARGTMQHPGRKVQGRPDPGHPHVRLGSARNPVGAEGAGRSRKSKMTARRRPVTPASTSQCSLARAKRGSWTWPAGARRTST
jgi:hypothetical protein